MVQITRESILTGEVNTMTFYMSANEYKECYEKWQTGAFIQDAFPMLTRSEREFIKSGITPDEWSNQWGEE